MNNNPSGHQKLPDRRYRAQIRAAAKKLYNQIPGITGVRPRDILDYLYPEYKPTDKHPDLPINYINISEVLTRAGYRVICRVQFIRGASWYVDAEDAKTMVKVKLEDPVQKKKREEHWERINQIQQQILTAAEKLIKTHPGGIRSIDVVEAMYGHNPKHYGNPNKTRTRHVAKVLRSNGWISVRPVRSGRAIFTKPAATGQESESAGTSET